MVLSANCTIKFQAVVKYLHKNLKEKRVLNEFMMLLFFQ